MHSLTEKVLSGDRRALARALSVVEDRRQGYTDILKDLYREGGKARIIGVTGPPGAGKSTLVNRMIGAYRDKGLTVAVIAVDPSSAFSGGAILGDRIRMQERALDEGVFIRSMATRGHMGGLAQATGDALTVFDAAGFDVVLVETVGVGQDEVDIVREANTVLVLMVPGMGDDIQAIKAGIMEIADLFVINKADREGVDRVERELHAALTLAEEELDWVPPIVKTVAAKGEGVDRLLAGRGETLGPHLQRAVTPGQVAPQVQLQVQGAAGRAVSPARQAEVDLGGGGASPSGSLRPARIGSVFGGGGDSPPGAMGDKTLKVEHVGIAVKSLEESGRFYEDLGLLCSGEEEVSEQKVKAAFFPIGETRIELLESTDPTGPIAKFLDKKRPRAPPYLRGSCRPGSDLAHP